MRAPSIPLKERRLGVLTVAMAAASWVVPVSASAADIDAAGHAGGQAQPGSRDEAKTLDTIVVTAQKREQSLQEVPLSITAIDAERIETRGFDGFTDYARTVPGLSFVDRGSGRNKITLRGVSTGVDQNNQSPVGVYIDETPVSFPNNEPDLRLFDVERIEVLRGPQGTLYGAGSMGGTLRIIPASPQFGVTEGAFSAQASTTHQGGDSTAVNGMLNVPMGSESLALRAVAYHRNEGGWVDNVQLDERDVNDNETWGARVALRAQFSPAFEATLSVLHQNADIGGTQETNPALPGLSQERAVPELRSDAMSIYSLKLDYDFGGAALTSSTSYLDREIVDTRDVSAILNIGSSVWLNNTIPDRNFIQEFRLTSAQGERFEWIVGAYYSHRTGGLRQLAWHDGAFGIPPAVPLLDSTIRNDIDQIALFGEASLHFNERWTLTGGLRAFELKDAVDKVSDGLIAGGYSTDSGRSKETGINPKVNLSYQASSNVMVYAQAAEGFRAGGPNSTIPPHEGVTSPSTFASDSLWNYEVGVKSALWGGKGTLNAALFYIDWTDIQVTVTRPDGWSYTTNGNAAVSKGVEAELSVRPVAGLELGASFAYTDAKLTQDSASGAGLSGERIPAVPRVGYNLFARYDWALSNGWYPYVQADWQGVGSTLNGFASNNADRQEGYELLNARVGVRVGDFDVSLFASNLLDERAQLYVDRTLGDHRVNVNRPRTIGVNVSGRF